MAQISSKGETGSFPVPPVICSIYHVLDLIKEGGEICVRVLIYYIYFSEYAHLVSLFIFVQIIFFIFISSTSY